jgi:hypothetical protein
MHFSRDLLLDLSLEKSMEEEEASAIMRSICFQIERRQRLGSIFASSRTLTG